jgi:hypothetical protein
MRRIPFASRRALELVLVTAPALLFMVHISGCTVMGPIAGAVIDGLRKDRTPRTVVNIHPGSHVALYLRNGTSVRGRFDGRHDMGPEAYAREWAAWRDTAKQATPLPAPGDSVLLTRTDGKTCLGTLTAYEIDAVVVATSGESCTMSVESIRSMADRTGHVVDSEVLREATRHATVPLSSMIRVQTKDGLIETPLHHVREVEGPAPRAGKVIGLVVGLGTDIALIAAAVSEASNSGCEGGYSGGGFGY